MPRLPAVAVALLLLLPGVAARRADGQTPAAPRDSTHRDSTHRDSTHRDSTPAGDTTTSAIGYAPRALGGLYRRYPWFPQLVGAQFTYIWQDLPPFNAPYSGKLSLTPHGDNEGTHTYGLYFGARATAYLQVYVDFEMARGSGVSHATGLAGLTDGDVIRQGSVNLGQGPYLARAYVRYMIPLTAERDTVTHTVDQLPGVQPSTRIEIKAGKFALNDDLDNNSYANTTRYQFMDWGLWNDLAWDFAADTRGYTNGLLIGYVSRRWSLKLAAAEMPTFANGNVFDGDLLHAYGLNAELTIRPGNAGTAVRFLAYQNRGNMGIYRDAINAAKATDTVPNIVADDAKGRVKYGFGLNVEQPLGDSGNTGIFLRIGWNDGRTEDFVFSEADRHLSGGLQLAGNLWHRPMDRVGIAATIDGLSKDHADYLAAGGIGFLIGDGALRYGTENITELYYRFEVPYLTFAQISPAIQHIDHPGYNEDRGPLYIYTIRVNLHY